MYQKYVINGFEIYVLGGGGQNPPEFSGMYLHNFSILSSVGLVEPIWCVFERHPPTNEARPIIIIMIVPALLSHEHGECVPGRETLHIRAVNYHPTARGRTSDARKRRQTGPRIE